MIAALWILTLMLLGLWSLFAWGLHTLLTVDPGWLGDLQPLIDRIPYAELIDRWLPGWRDLLALALDLSQIALGWVGHAAPWLAWLLWGAGAAGLLLLAALGTLAIRLLRRPPSPAVRA